MTTAVEDSKAILEGNSVAVVTKSGHTVLLDTEDYLEVVGASTIRVCRAKEDSPYARVFTGGEDLHLHRAITGALPGEEVTFLDKNTLNCTRSNLRVVTRSVVSARSKKRANTSSIYKGVSRYRGGWAAEVSCNSERYRLGTFKSEVAAAKAYDAKAKELFGDLSTVNLPG